MAQVDGNDAHPAVDFGQNAFSERFRLLIIHQILLPAIYVCCLYLLDGLQLKHKYRVPDAATERIPMDCGFGVGHSKQAYPKDGGASNQDMQIRGNIYLQEIGGTMPG
jgi:hypothetical protein